MAARIYSYFRIKHHLLPSDFHASWYFRFGILVSAMLGGLVFYRQKDERVKILGWFCLATLAISAIGLVVGWLAPYAPTVAAKLLRYYWFRLADAMVPLMVSVLVCRMLVDQRQVLRRIGFSLLVLFRPVWSAFRLFGLPGSEFHHRSAMICWESKQGPRLRSSSKFTVTGCLSAAGQSSQRIREKCFLRHEISRLSSGSASVLKW